MSILIPGMKMPKHGDCVVIFSDGNVRIFKAGLVVFTGREFEEGNKVIELPPHGDLIDREKIPFVESENGCQDDYAFRYDINEMTPVIPAEEE